MKPVVNAPAPFVELEALVVTVEQKPKVTELDAAGKPVRKVRPLRLVSGADAGIVRVQPIGGRLTLRPSDPSAVSALGAARAALGWHWDAKAKRHVYHFDNFLRRGVTEWDSLRLLAAMTGLPLEMAPGVEKGIARYRSRLERQLRPIPRVTWLDEDAAKEDSELEAEIALGDQGAALRRWGQGGGWWQGRK
jgi:hypothetical protein